MLCRCAPLLPVRAAPLVRRRRLASAVLPGLLCVFIPPCPACPAALPCSAAMSIFYLWNLLLFKPNLAAKQH